MQEIFSEQEIRELEALFKRADDRHLRNRCQALLMLSRNRPRPQIAEDLGVSLRTLQRWLHLWRQGGIKALPIEWGPGRTPILGDQDLEDVVGIMTAGPQESSGREKWTYADLAAVLSEEFGVQMSETTARAYCHRYGIRIHRGGEITGLEDYNKD